MAGKDSRWHNEGIEKLFRRATSKSPSPGLAETSTSLILSFRGIFFVSFDLDRILLADIFADTALDALFLVDGV